MTQMRAKCGGRTLLRPPALLSPRLQQDAELVFCNVQTSRVNSGVVRNQSEGLTN
jgi:hypothetical protein